MKLLYYWLSRVRMTPSRRRDLQGDPIALQKAFREDNGGLTLNELREEVSEVRRKGIDILFPGDPRYERLFSELKHEGVSVPYILYMKGDLNVLDHPGIAFVGSRQPSDYGVRVTRELVKSLVRKGVSIISGGARGIDTAAHECALAVGLPTICVLGCGIGWNYPPENAALFRTIVRKGLLLSEYRPGERPKRYTFPERNRIIAQLSEAVVVTAAAKDSGSLITAESAMECGRRVLTVPYGIYDKEGEGCNFLLETGAGLILNGEQFSSMIL